MASAVIPAAFAYARADSVDEAVALLAEHGDDAKLLAGGHSLLPLMKLRLATPSVLVDVGRLDELSFVRDDGDTLAIGGLTRHHDVEHDAVLREHVPLLAAAAGEVGDPQVRHRGTLGGSLAHGDPASDLPAVVLALRGSIVVRGSGGERVIAADDFFRGFLETALAPDEIITEVRVPKTGGAGWAFEKFNRRAQDWAIVGVAAVGGDTPGVALVNMGSTPVRAGAVEGCAARRRVGRRRRRARGRRHRTAVGSERVTRVPTPPGAGARRPRPRHRRQHRRSSPMTTTFGAGSLVGVPVRRVEDPTLLRGEGTYIDNLDLPGALHLSFVRSPMAHAEITAIDTSDAREMPGVVAVYAATDLDFPDHTGMMQLHPAVVRPALARDKVRFVGDAVAVVVAESKAQAVDAAEAVIVDYEPLPAATDMESALARRRAACSSKRSARTC